MTNENALSTSDKRSSKEADSNQSKKPWERMRLTYTGEAKDVVRGGVAKHSPNVNDPGDAAGKPPGHA